MPKNTAIKHIKSSVSGNVPTYTDLEYGELALNYTDGSLFYRDSSDNVVPIASSKDNLLSGEYAFSTATSATDPGVGGLRLNNATASMATALYIDQLSYTKANMDNAFTAMRIGDIITIQNKSDGSSAVRYRLTSGPPTNNVGWWSFAVEWVDSSGSFSLWANSTILSVTITRMSRIGTTGLLDNSVSLAKMADMATSSLIYRKTAGTGDPEVNTLATLKTDLGLSGTNSGDQTITLSGDVSGTGTGAITTTLRNGAATSVIGRSANSSGTPADIAASASGQVLRRNGTTLQFDVPSSSFSPTFLNGDTTGPTDSTTWVSVFASTGGWGTYNGTATLPIGLHWYRMRFRLGRSAGVTSTTLQFRLDSGGNTNVAQTVYYHDCFVNQTASSLDQNVNTINTKGVKYALDLSDAATICTTIGDSSMIYDVEIEGYLQLSGSRSITPQIKFGTGSGYTSTIFWPRFWQIQTNVSDYGLIS